MEYMDIDGPEFLLSVNNEIAHIRANTNQRNDSVTSHLFDSLGPSRLETYNEICVLDTNFLISKLGYLDTVLNLSEKHYGSLLVILPWVVIRELDGLKSSSRSDGVSEADIGMRARKAMRFIEERLREKSVSLRGQKMNEILDPNMSKNHAVKGDDRILDCCMYFHQVTQKRVSLLSNDRNLSIKVMVHDIESISAESVPKMESLLNRIAGVGARKTSKKAPIYQQQETEDYVMEIDEFYPPQQQVVDEDYDMMIDDDEVYTTTTTTTTTTTIDQLNGTTMDSKWANAVPTPKPRHRKKKSDDNPVPSYLDNDPTLVAPKKPFNEKLTSSNSNRVPIHKDASWSSLYTPF